MGPAGPLDPASMIPGPLDPGPIGPGPMGPGPLGPGLWAPGPMGPGSLRPGPTGRPGPLGPGRAISYYVHIMCILFAYQYLHIICLEKERFINMLLKSLPIRNLK